MVELERLAARMVCVGFDGLTPTPEVVELIHQGVGGVILFARNVASAAQVAELTAALKGEAAGAGRQTPLLVAVDQEGGRVARLRPEHGFTALPSMRALGERDDEELAWQVGRVIGTELRAVGIDVALAPVLDVDTNAQNPVIGDRSLGRDPQRVGRLGRALIGGIQSAQVAACGKHFPGHGDTTLDSHLALPRLSHGLARLEAVELPPFAEAIEAAVAGVMTAHVVFDAVDTEVPATMSRAAVEGILRRRLGFEGVVVSDDLEMKAIADPFGVAHAAVCGAQAGVDLMLVCHDPQRQRAAIRALADAVARGTLAAEVLQAAHARLEGLCTRFAGRADAPARLDLVGCAEHLAIVAAVEEKPVATPTPPADPTARWREG